MVADRRLALALLRLIAAIRARRQPRIGVHEVLQNRNQLGQFQTFLKLKDHPEKFRQYTRFTVEEWEHLKILVQSK